MADTNVILKYRRPQDSWLCPECDSENAPAYSNCFVCGSCRVGAPVVVRAWNEMDERPPAPPKISFARGKSTLPPSRTSSTFGSDHSGSKPLFVGLDRPSDKPAYEEPKSYTATIIVCTMLIIAIIMIVSVLKINGTI